MFLTRNKLFIEVVFVVIAFFYYLLFLNKGLVLYDEGYYYHIADRILQGQVPYTNFFLQFSPGYFYLLAVFLKIFGEQVIVGRLLTLFLCLLILFLNLKISNRFKLSYFDKSLAFLATVSFGFPLINNPGILAWASVLCSLVLVYSVFFWLEDQSSFKRQIAVGLSLALVLLVKQNIGLYFFVVTSLYIFFQAKNKLESLLFIYLSFIIPTLTWLLYFFAVQGDLSRFFEFITFNKNYSSIYSLSYPSLKFLTGPTGFLKLLPYYLPIAFLVFLLKEMRNTNSKIIFFSFISLAGFIGTVIPTSDLLHVYPFYSLVLITILLAVQNNKFKRIWIFLIILSIVSGFYLTIFREYYRYQLPYYMQDTALDIPRAKGIYVDRKMSNDLNNLNSFISKNASNHGYIFSYPFAPMLYFILDRQNPSRYSIYYPGYLSSKQEEEVISEIKVKNVKYIITASEYKFTTPLSKYIQSKKIIKDFDFFKIFAI